MDSKKDVLLYILLISAILCSTVMMCLTLVGFIFVFQNPDFSMDFFIIVISMVLGIFGYLGLMMLVNGLHETNHRKKIICLSSGLIGFTMFMIQISSRNILDWIMEFDDGRSLIVKWPLLVTLIFLILTIHDFLKNKNLSEKEM